MKKVFLLNLMAMFSLTGLTAQSKSLVSSFTAGEFAKCITLSEDLLKDNPNDAQAHFYKGAALVKLKNYALAESALEQALKANFQPKAAVNANLLKAYAGQQKTDLVLQHLEKMVGNGFAVVSVLNSDEFAYLENQETFATLKEAVDKNANPCKYGEQYQRLDFWIGEWDVFVNTTKIADSKITKSVGACSLHEDYQTLSGFSGMSMSYYDPVDSLYKQTWIDKFNSIIQFWEVKSEAGFLQMHANGRNNSLVRMTYQYDEAKDEVTQSMENSTDNGKSWVSSYVGVYKRKK